MLFSMGVMISVHYRIRTDFICDFCVDKVREEIYRQNLKEDFSAIEKEYPELADFFLKKLTTRRDHTGRKSIVIYSVILNRISLLMCFGWGDFFA